MAYKDQEKYRKYVKKASEKACIKNKAKNLLKKNRAKYAAELKKTIRRLRIRRKKDIKRGLWRWKDGREVEGEYYQCVEWPSRYFIKLKHLDKFTKYSSLDCNQWTFIRDLENDNDTASRTHKEKTEEI